MNKSLKIPSPWAQLGFLVTFYLGGMVLVAVLVTIFNIPTQIVDNPRVIMMSRLLQVVYTSCTFLLPATLVAILTSWQPVHSFLGFKPAQKASFYLLGVAILLCSIPFQGWVGELNSRIPFPPSVMKMEEDSQRQMTAYLSHRAPVDLFLNLIVMAAIPAICEEAFFRGAMQRIFIQATRKPWPAIILTAAIFSFIHFQFLGFFPRMFMGMLLGAIYWYSGSLWTSILAHFCINAIQILAVWKDPTLIEKDASFPVWSALVSLAIVVGLLELLRRRSTTSYESHLNGTAEASSEGGPR